MAAVNVVTTSTIVNFSSTAGNASNIFRLEVDDRPAGLNKGNTSFRPGDNVGLLLFQSANVTLLEILVTFGSLANKGATTKTLDDQWLTYGNEPEASVGYPLTTYDFGWVGTDLGGVTLINENVFRLTSIPTDRYVGVARVESGISPCTSYQLTNTLIPGEDDYRIGIYAFGEAT